MFEKEIRQKTSLESKKEMKGSENSPATKIKRSNEIVLVLVYRLFSTVNLKIV